MEMRVGSNGNETIKGTANRTELIYNRLIEHVIMDLLHTDRTVRITTAINDEAGLMGRDNIAATMERGAGPENFGAAEMKYEFGAGLDADRRPSLGLSDASNDASC